MKQLDECHVILADPYGYAGKLKAKSGKKSIGTLCSYTPEEIIVAAGANPIRLFGTTGEIRLSDAHLQSYCCSLVRRILEDALAGPLAFLDGCIFPHTCDTIQRLSDIWRLNIGGCHWDVVLPVKLDTPASRQYFIDVLNRFREELGATLGKEISDDDLRDAIVLSNRIRRAMTRIYQFKSEAPENMPGTDLYALTRTAMIMDRTDVAVLLEAVTAELENRSARTRLAGRPDTGGLEEQGAVASRSVKKRVVIAGGVCNHPDIAFVIEEAGGEVVGDDLCTGARYFSGLIDERADPIAALAERYRERVVCPAKHQGLSERADHLVRLVREKRAQGVIFFLLKFCDPHAFDYPYLKAALSKAGIASMVVEAEDRLSTEGQMRTRLEAFLEMI
jgi:benzoyl-CoA reductase subunit C